MATAKAVRRREERARGQGEPETKQYFLSDETVVVLTDELCEYAHELEAVWRRLKEQQPAGEAEIDGIAEFETTLFVLRTRCDTIQRQLDKLSRRLPNEDEEEAHRWGS